MTIQVISHNRSKRILREALRTRPEVVTFLDPSIFHPRVFTGADIPPGTKLTVVMDHPKRTRFAIVVHSPKVGFRVM